MEEKNKNNNRKLILTITGVLLLVALVIGVTYAAWNYTFNGTKVSSLSTADIKLELLESDDNIISIANALPMSDAQGKAQTTYFDFVVTSKTVRDIDVDYTITLEKLTPDTGYTSLNDNQIKVYLTNTSNTQLVAPTLISGLTTYQLYGDRHEHDSSHNKVQSKYRLRAWIDQNVNASSWTSETKYQYKFRLNVSGGEYQAPQENVIYSYVRDKNGNTIPSSPSQPLSKSEAVVPSPSLLGAPLLAAPPLADELSYNVYLGDSANSIYIKTTDYTDLNSNYFLRHVLGDNDIITRNDVCFIKDNTLYCLKGVETANAGYNAQNPAPYYQENCNTLLEAFGPNAEANNVCSVASNRIYCSASGLDARAYVGGDVDAVDGSSYCVANDRGSSGCFE